MTVATETSYAELIYTGAETTFTPGFSALNTADVFVSWFDVDRLPVALTQGMHFSVALGADGAVTVSKIAFPVATALAPVTIAIERVTPAVQGTDFDNLAAYDASVHERIADAGAMRDAELRGRQARAVTPFAGTSNVVDFRPRNVRAADPLVDSDVATKGWVMLVTGLINIAASVASAAASAVSAAASAALALTRQTASEAARDLAQLWANQTEDTPVTTGPSKFSAFHWSQKSAASAALVLAALAVTDYGTVAAAPTETRDYGTVP
jgi:hypothetical protein